MFLTALGDDLLLIVFYGLQSTVLFVGIITCKSMDKFLYQVSNIIECLRNLMLWDIYNERKLFS